MDKGDKGATEKKFRNGIEVEIEKK